MNQAERDTRLISIDERLKSLDREITENVKKDISDIKKYNELQNGHIRELTKECSANSERCKTNYKLVCIAIGIAVSAMGIGFNVEHIANLMP